MYRLHLFSGPSIEGPAGPLVGRIVQRRQFALLALLGASHGKPLTREKLIGLMWPETPDVRARRLLSDTAYVIRQALQADALLGVGDALQLNTELVWSDTNAFDVALEEGRLLDAVELYRGPFLDGFYVDGAHDFDRWMEDERRRLVERYLDALEALAEGADADGDTAGAIRWWKRRNAVEPTNSRVALRLAEALVAAGDHAGAVHHIRFHESVLRNDVGVGLPSEFASVLGALQRPADRSTLTEAPASPAPRREWGAQPAGARDAEPIPTPVSTRPQNLRRVVAVAVAVIAILSLGLGIRALAGPRGADSASSLLSVEAPPPPVATVAVLPFRELDPEGDGYFAAGLTDDLRSRLARSHELAVISPTAVEWAREEGRLALTTVGEKLGADYLVRGSVRRGPQLIRVIAELVDARSGRTLWSEAFDRPLLDLFLVQSDLASRIAGRLGARDAPGAASGLGKSTPQDIEAYELFLEARWLWHRSMYGQWVPTTPQASAEVLERMMERLEHSLALDSTYAPAYALLGDLLLSRRPGIPSDSGLAMLRRSLALDDRLPLGHQTLARHFYLREGRIAAAREEARRALEVDPNYLPAMVSFAEMSDGVGALDEAFLWAQRAWTVAPNAPSWYRAEWVARVYWLTGSPERARPILQRLAEIDGGPRGRLARGRLADLHLTEGRIDEARRIAWELHASGEQHPVNSLNRLALVELHAGNWEAAIRHLEELLAAVEGYHDRNTVTWPILQVAPTNLGFAYRKIGRMRESEEMLARSQAFQEEALSEGRVMVGHHFDLGRIAAIRGDLEGALRHLEEALANGWMYGYTFLGAEAPQWERLRGDPRFHELMDREKDRLDSIRRRLATMGLGDWTLEALFPEDPSEVR